MGCGNQCSIGVKGVIESVVGLLAHHKMLPESVVALRTTHPTPSTLHAAHCNSQVDLYDNGTIAIVEAVSPELGNRVQRVRVQLPGTSSELLQKFREKKIDFAAHSNAEDGGAVFLNLLGECAGGLRG